MTVGVFIEQNIFSNIMLLHEGQEMSQNKYFPSNFECKFNSIPNYWVNFHNLNSSNMSVACLKYIRTGI